MKRILEKIRQKPMPVKKTIAFFMTIVLMFLITGLWIVSLDKTINSTSQKASVSEASRPLEILTKLFSGAVVDENR